ncbi:transketolase [Ignicoccus pacificus DSM 13166]|uniref:2-oxoacid oxidoreductase (ferredoxin) n=1 Tax=Ignicoccus pacificus DSM 13166 TaxID=940294 RepID=A0A977K9E6_9CREN|nr:transketolase [Ignicoccus pacificus DSM 13166]
MVVQVQETVKKGKEEIVSEISEYAKLARRYVIEMASVEKTVHAGSSLSVVDILTTIWYMDMKNRTCREGPLDHNWLILSKGHAVPAFYGVLAAFGLIKPELVRTIRDISSPLQGHPDDTLSCVDAPTGSLAQGFSFGVGVAKGLKMKGSDKWVYVILGDGELDEGEVWEAASTAASLRLDNLIAIVDWNRFQLDGETEKVKSKGDLQGKWRAFGWHVLVLDDGHDHERIMESILEAKKLTKELKRPVVILAKTTRGKGIPTIENTKQQRVSPEEAKKLLESMKEDTL